MRKILSIMVATIMLLSIISILSQDLTIGAYLPPDTGTSPIIKAKWEEPDSADPSHLREGTQILPPMKWGSKVPVRYCVVVTDINGKDNVNTAWVDIYHPDGSFKYQFQLSEVDTSTPSTKQSAAEMVQSAYDNGLLKLNNPYTLQEVKDEVLENSAKLFCGSADLDYHQMCGMYTVKAYAFDKEQSISQMFENQFEYVCMAGIEMDFDSINFGEVIQSSNKWVEGDWIWDTPNGPACNSDEPLLQNCRSPTIRNIGNTPVYIEVEFDDMGFGQSLNGWNVEFDSSLKHDEDVVFDPFTPTRLPAGGVEPEPYCQQDYAVLDLCNTEKISFSMHIKKAMEKGHEYLGNAWIEPVAVSFPWFQNPKIINPDQGSVVSGVTLVAATSLTDIPPYCVESVVFSYSNDGQNWHTIGSAKDIDLLYWETQWDTSNLKGGNYQLKVTVKACCGTYEDVIDVYVNEEPVPIFEAFLSFTELGHAVIFDGSSSYDPDGTIVDYIWGFDDGTVLNGPIVGYPLPPRTPNSTLQLYLEFTVIDNRETFYTEHSIIVIEYDPEGLPYIVSWIPKSCGCDFMEVKNVGNSFADMWWLPAGSNRQLGAYDNINMTLGGDPSFQIVHNFEVIAHLFPHSDQSKCQEGQKVKRTFHTDGRDYNKTYNESVNYGIAQSVVTCPFGGASWCDDDYHQRDNQVKFYINQSEIRWLDGPGHDNVRKSWFNPDGTSYKANFAARVWGSGGSCECTWDVIMEVDTAGAVTKNGIENLNCV